MCGIAGYITKKEFNHEEVITKITASFSYRGPDDHGFFVDKNETDFVVLGHRRLSIIDLSNAGHQPMVFEHLSVVFNGEIYNYKEIKTELTKLGHQFTSNSDTEVILHAYLEWGNKAVHKFIGMFAFAIYDKKNNKVKLFRDRTGVKPLYYSQINNELIFSSEIKGIIAYPQFQKKISKQGASLFFKYGYILGEQTIYEGVKKLLAGHFLEFDLQNQSTKIEKYWEVLDYYNQPTLELDYKEAKKQLKEILLDSINLRMVADVPVGLFLSGGYDSSLVASLLKQSGYGNIETFTIGFEDKKYDESNQAKEIANHLGLKNHLLYCKNQDARDILPNLPKYYDEPFADISSIPSILLSQFASKQVKVVLSADAGDEIFAGYEFYRRAMAYQKNFSPLHSFKHSSAFALELLNNIVPKDKARVKHNLKGLAEIIKSPKNKATINYHHLFSQKNNDQLVYNLLGKFTSIPKTSFDTVYDELNKKNLALNNILAVDYKTYLVDNILTKIDRATMSASIEGREPLLDHRIVEFAARLPESYKFHNGKQKIILKDICHDDIPENLINRPKKGFDLPLYQWLNNELKDFSIEYLSAEKSQKAGILNPAFVEYVKKEFFKGNHHYNDMAWYIITFNNWANYWL